MTATQLPQLTPAAAVVNVEKRRGRNKGQYRSQLPLRTRMARSWQLYVLVIPPVIFALLFLYWPMYGLQLAFKNYNITKGITGSPWAGTRYVEQFINSYLFWPVLKNTLILSFYSLVATFPLPIILALLLNTVRRSKFKKAVQMITYAPHFISTVIVVGIIFMLFSPSSGVVNVAIQALFGQTVDFVSAGWFRHTYVWSGAWQQMGFAAIIYLAALAGIDPELHEAARVDGAGVLRRIWHIDVPGILPVMITLLILSMGNILSSDFTKILLMQNNNNLGTSQVIDTYSYQIAFRSAIPQYSYATAIGLFKSIISFVLLMTVNFLSKKITKNSLF
ncbi:ABC-type polysaccharide transport system permease subunit [Friedmanniella endophytica]|uniref:ABC-type polysaccharide transport system permease subunit n=1 Tax=Microlunatus kandeliicorticis TaxID=1759536 RepID=A0A7W3IUS4_9ACTN|nr:ABC transporter permease subunit [Microlunatus kandeliicorticis]MBA8795648.1 ABC-type polysaccharide transport system permease subunit [Microlunatus kandeliicorticis]